MNIKKYLETFVPLVNKKIKNILQDRSFPKLYDGMEYAINVGGKRIRPVLCLAVYKTIGGDEKQVLPFATAIELIHNFTLIHDDIEDCDELRRGSLTVWKKYGIAHGINIGDGLIFKAYEELLKSRSLLSEEKVLNLIHMLSTTVMRIIEGQNMEFNFRKRNSVSIEEYEEMAIKKAGVLFGLCLSGAALIGNSDGKTIENLMEYGKKIGLVFQIRDDVLNLIGKQEKYGKEICSDIKEGKRTLITIQCLKKCNNVEKKKLLEILKKDRNGVFNEDVKFVMSLIRKYNSIQFAEKHAEKLFEESKEYLKNVKSDELKNILEEFADFMINREY